MAFKFLGQRQLGKLPSRWVSTILMVAIRTCIHNRLTPSGQVFSRPAALKNLAIHQVLLRFFALQGGKIPCPACIIRL